jgi:hypothetical protein
MLDASNQQVWAAVAGIRPCIMATSMRSLRSIGHRRRRARVLRKLIVMSPSGSRIA